MQNLCKLIWFEVQSSYCKFYFHDWNFYKRNEIFYGIALKQHISLNYCKDKTHSSEPLYAYRHWGHNKWSLCSIKSVSLISSIANYGYRIPYLVHSLSHPGVLFLYGNRHSNMQNLNVYIICSYSVGQMFHLLIGTLPNLPHKEK